MMNQASIEQRLPLECLSLPQNNLLNSSCMQGQYNSPPGSIIESIGIFEREEQQCRSECDSESNDSTVSFQDQLLDQHIFCLRFGIDKLQYLCKQYRIKDLLSTEQSFQLQLQMSLNELLLHQKRLTGDQIHHCFKTSIKNERKLRKFLCWLYGSMPQFLMPEVVLVFQKIVAYHYPLRFITLQSHELIELVNRPQFLRSIYEDENLNILNYGKYVNELGSARGFELGKTADFMKFYAVTVLSVIQNIFNNPFYKKVRQIKAVELAERYKQRKMIIKSVLSRKIKKEKGRNL